MKKLVLIMFFFLLTTYMFNIYVYAEDVPDSKEQADIAADEEEAFVDIEMEATFVKDPIQPFNRSMFTFNDKVYYYFFRPLSNGYKAILPEVARVGIRNFFINIRTPIRLFNCLFQGKFEAANDEWLRLLINSTIGGAGFSDPAKKYFKLDIHDEDFGQTLGHYDVGAGSFLELPLLGPSNVRDAIGLLGDIVLDPITLLTFISPFASTGAKAYITLNDVSIDKGETYESLVEMAIDPYIAVQDAYTQNRAKKIRE